MNPAPSPAPTNAAGILMAEIERIAQELRAYNKRPLPATKDQVEGLVKLAERDRPVTVQMSSEEIVELLTGQVDAQAKVFQATGKVFQATGHELVKSLDDRLKLLYTSLDDRLKLLYKELDKRLAAVEAVEAKLRATVQQIPTQIPIDWLANWRVTAGFAVGPLVIVLLTMLCTGHFSRVPKADLEKVQAENEQLRQRNARLSKEETFYFDQVQQYRKKFPKNAPYFPKYVAPAAPAPVAD